MRIRGRAAMVTGGSRGLGAALGRALAAAGARVVLVARGGDDLEGTVHAIRAAGGEAHALVGDVGDKEHVHFLAGAAAALVGPVDLLVHNASTLGPTPLRLLLDTDCEDLERVLSVNLVGPFRLTKALAGSRTSRCLLQDSPCRRPKRRRGPLRVYRIGDRVPCSGRDARS